MAKSKNTKKVAPTKVTHKGATYLCAKKNGKVTVKIARTASGQNLVAGVYDINSESWHHDNGQIPFPKEAKATIAKLYPKP